MGAQNSRGPAEKLALKSEWQLSGASEGQRLGTIALGAANVVRLPWWPSNRLAERADLPLISRMMMSHQWKS